MPGPNIHSRNFSAECKSTSPGYRRTCRTMPNICPSCDASGTPEVYCVLAAGPGMIAKRLWPMSSKTEYSNTPRRVLLSSAKSSFNSTLASTQKVNVKCLAHYPQSPSGKTVRSVIVTLGEARAYWGAINCCTAFRKAPPPAKHTTSGLIIKQDLSVRRPSTPAGSIGLPIRAPAPPCRENHWLFTAAALWGRSTAAGCAATAPAPVALETSEVPELDADIRLV